MTSRTILTTKDVEYIINQNIDGISERNLALEFNVSRYLIGKVVNRDFESKYIDADVELVLENVRLAKNHQKNLDVNRVRNKSFREHARIENAVEALDKELINVFTKNKLTKLTTFHDKPRSVMCGIVHLSDLHFNEQIEMDNNTFNFDIASKRIRKHITMAKAVFSGMGIRHVIVCLTGDILNGDRRLEELLLNADNRSRAVFLGVDILQQAILDLNTEFNVSVFSITGNEGRVNKDISWVPEISSDNYDLVIHNILGYLFQDSEGVDVVKINDPLEQIVHVNGKHILMIHGHNGLANTAKMEVQVAKVRARYISKGIDIDYVIAGHIHQAYISDIFARSGGLPGANHYSEKALNIDGRASQNLYIVEPEGGGIHGIKVDLQNTDGIEGYAFNQNLEAYNNVMSDTNRSNVIIQSVLV